LAWFWTRADFYEALASQIENVPETAAACRRTGGLGDLPLTVVSAANDDPGWETRQAASARLSKRGRHISAPDSGHWIPLDRPDLVVRVVREMVTEVRRGPSPTQPETIP
jgi:pimeloyl-ACP methyl ester carboxylesterase